MSYFFWGYYVELNYANVARWRRYYTELFAYTVDRYYLLFFINSSSKSANDKNMLSEISRGDVIVTNGGLVGKVKKVSDEELNVDFNGNEIKVVRTMIADVRNKPAPANDTGKKKK